MSEATTALRLMALEDLDLRTLLGDRFRPSHMAQLDVMPCATYETISTVPDEALDGDMGHETQRVQFDVYADEHDQARAIARRLRGVMLDAYGILPTDETDDPAVIVIDGMSTAGGMRDYPAETPINGGDAWRYRVSFDLFVSFNP